MDTESITLQQQVNDLSQLVQVLQQQMAQVLEAQAIVQSQVKFLEKQSETRIREQEIQAKRARLALPRLP